MSKRRRGKKQAAAASAPGSRTILQLATLELATGHDGRFRGTPEPVIILAAYWIDGGVRTLGRTLARFDVEGQFPERRMPAEHAEIAARLPAKGRLVVVGVAIEQDDGGDVERTYGLLEDVTRLRFWSGREEVPAPKRLDELPVPRGLEVVPVHVLDGVRDLGDTIAVDDYVGASLVFVPCDGDLHEVRMHFVDAERLNDWTAIVGVRSHTSPECSA